jgi:hypothetical protein
VLDARGACGARRNDSGRPLHGSWRVLGGARSRRLGPPVPNTARGSAVNRAPCPSRVASSVLTAGSVPSPCGGFRNGRCANHPAGPDMRPSRPGPAGWSLARDGPARPPPTFPPGTAFRRADRPVAPSLRRWSRRARAGHGISLEDRHFALVRPMFRLGKLCRTGSAGTVEGRFDPVRVVRLSL